MTKPLTRTFYTLKDADSRALDAYWFVADGYIERTKRQAVALRKGTDGGTEVVRVEVTVREIDE